MGYRAKTKIELEDGVGEKEREGSFLYFSRPYRAPLARLADFSFRPIPHLGACSQAMEKEKSKSKLTGKHISGASLLISN